MVDSWLKTLLQAGDFLASKRAGAADRAGLQYDSGGVRQEMKMMFFLDTVTGTLMASRAVLGIALAGLVILVEALALYKLGWAVDLTKSSDDIPQTTTAAYSPGKQFVACLRDSFMANVASALVGWLLSQYVFFFSFWSIPFWITAFVTTLVVESLALWVLRKKSLGKSGIAALAANASSYLLLIFLFGLIYQLGLAAEI